MRLIDYIKSLFKTNSISRYDEELSFSISVGENCEVCFEQFDYYKGVGYKGKPTKCETCKKQLSREDKLKELGI
jgi:hypothetical protein